MPNVDRHQKGQQGGKGNGLNQLNKKALLDYPEFLHKNVLVGPLVPKHEPPQLQHLERS